MNADNCPYCGVSLIGDPIPDKAGENYRREHGIVENDRIVEWQCPDCGRTWPR